jgi:hypothetical protein
MRSIFFSRSGQTATLVAVLFLPFLTGCRESEEQSKENQDEIPSFSLVIPKDYEVEAYAPEFQKWTDSLIENLGYQRTKIICLEFLQTDIKVTESGRPTDGVVYVCWNNPELFYLQGPRLVVNFEEKIIGTGGMSVHFNNSGRLCVLLVPSPQAGIYGVRLGDSKATSSDPVFEDPMSVSYQYR